MVIRFIIVIIFIIITFIILYFGSLTIACWCFMTFTYLPSTFKIFFLLLHFLLPLNFLFPFSVHCLRWILFDILILSNGQPLSIAELSYVLFRVLLKIVLRTLHKLFSLLFILIKVTCLRSCFNHFTTFILKSSRWNLLSESSNLNVCCFLSNSLKLLHRLDF